MLWHKLNYTKYTNLFTKRQRLEEHQKCNAVGGRKTYNVMDWLYVLIEEELLYRFDLLIYVY